MTEPRLRVRASGHGGSGYVYPVVEGSGHEGKPVKNADSETILARTEDGTKKGKTIVVPGVTTILRRAAKPELDQWRADSVAAKAAANVEGLMTRSEEEIFDFLRWAADEVRNDRAEVGTNMHEWIEADLFDGFYPEVETRDAEQMIEQWEQFKFEHDIRPVWAERTLWDELGRYAGTADLAAEIDDLGLVLIDTKTSRHTYPDHWEQLAALDGCNRALFESTRGANDWQDEQADHFDHLALLHIRPDDWTSKGEFIPAFAKLLVMPNEDRDMHLDSFLALNEHARLRYRIAENQKARAKSAQVQNP